MAQDALHFRGWQSIYGFSKTIEVRSQFRCHLSIRNQFLYDFESKGKKRQSHLASRPSLCCRIEWLEVNGSVLSVDQITNVGVVLHPGPVWSIFLMLLLYFGYFCRFRFPFRSEYLCESFPLRFLGHKLSETGICLNKRWTFAILSNLVSQMLVI